jgi:pyrroline-5-carboxylate reductase
MADQEFNRLVLIGAGKMGGAMLDGWLEQGCGAKSIAVIDPAPSGAMQALAKAGRVSLMNAIDPKGVSEGDVLVVAVKPQIMDAALEPVIAAAGSGILVISVAAGISLAAFEAKFGNETAIIRSMPNLPASIGLGMSVAVGNSAVTKYQRAIGTQLLGAVGKVAWVDDEAQIDAVTAVSGSGPAYVFHMIEAMAKAGEAEGLDPALAMTLAVETVRGAGVLAATSDLDPGTLRESVTSKGGTTQAALDVLMGEGRLEDLMGEAIKAATARSRELGS